MSDKRSVTTDALETLGTLIDSTQKRDAIHLAVEPVQAGERLEPGTHITVTDGIAMSADEDEALGIVDPFLKYPVRKGQWFWFVMYPRMVHSLRHVWTHPAFPDVKQETIDELRDLERVKNKQESQKWLQEFCDLNGPGYATVMELLDKGSLPSPDSEYYGSGGEYSKDYLHFNGSDAHGEIPPEFWIHAENVLGRKLKYHPQYFSCSC